MLGPFPGIVGAIRFRLIDQADADGIEHRLILAHRVHDALRRVRPMEDWRRQGRDSIEVGPCRRTSKPLKRVGPEMNRAVLIREKADGHELSPRPEHRKSLGKSMGDLAEPINRGRHGLPR